MDIKVYTGESYNVFTHETRTSYVMVDAATGAIVQTGACQTEVAREALALTSVKRAVQALEYLDIDSAVVYTDASTAVNEISGKVKNPKLVSYIKQRMAALKIPVDVKFTESDRAVLPNDIAEAADRIKNFDITAAEKHLKELFKYPD